MAAAFAPGGAGGSSVAEALEGRLQQVEQLLQQQLQQESRERRGALQALEGRVRGLELASATAASSSAAAKPLLAETNLASPTRLALTESSSSDEDDGGLCGILSDKAAQMRYGMASTSTMHESYALEESMWDASIFVFTECLETAPSLTVIGLLVLNIVIQLSFVLVVYWYMCDDPMSNDLLMSLLKFRAGVAHSAKYADMMQGMSLATQVCTADQKIPWAGVQMGLVGDISSAREGGVYLCTLAVFCWLLSLVTELDGSLRFGTAMLSLVKGQRTLLLKGEDNGDEETMRLESITARRFTFVLLLVVLPRLVAGGFLAFVGVKFLVATTSMGDLLLNALALAFIMDVDNMLYAAFAPEPLKNIVRSVATIALPKEKNGSQKVYGINTFLKLVLTFTVLLAVFSCYIYPFYERMNQAFDIVCSGQTNFVYSVNAASNFVEASTSYTKPVVDWTSQELSVLQLAKPILRGGLSDFNPPQKVLNAVRNETRTALLHVSWRDSTLMLHNITGFLQNLSIQSLDPSIGGMLDLRRSLDARVEESTRGLVCGDMSFTTNDDLMTQHLHTITGGLASGPVSSCREAVSLCHFMNMTALRALCPVTCGCRTFLAPRASFFAAPGFGCPKRCSTELAVEMRAEMESGTVLPCLDVLPSRFVEDPALQQYFRTFMKYIVGNGDTAVAIRSTLMRNGDTLGINASQSEEAFAYLVDGRFAETALSGAWDLAPGHPHPRGLRGCDFWTSWEVSFMLGTDLCETVDFRSLRPYCPVSCNCYAGALLCPPSCAKRVG